MLDRKPEPVGVMMLGGFRVSEGIRAMLQRTRDGLDGRYFRAARGTVEHPIRKAAHFGVSALASVLARGVWQRDYLLQGQQHRSAQDASTRAAAGTFATEGL